MTAHCKLKRVAVAGRYTASTQDGLRRGTAVARLLRLWIRIPHGCLSVVGVVWCQVQVNATSWSLVQRSRTECGVSEGDLETLRMRRPWPPLGSKRH